MRNTAGEVGDLVVDHLGEVAGQDPVGLVVVLPRQDARPARRSRRRPSRPSASRDRPGAPAVGSRSPRKRRRRCDRALCGTGSWSAWLRAPERGSPRRRRRSPGACRTALCRVPRRVRRSRVPAAGANRAMRAAEVPAARDVRCAHDDVLKGEAKQVIHRLNLD